MQAGSIPPVFFSRFHLIFVTLFPLIYRTCMLLIRYYSQIEEELPQELPSYFTNFMTLVLVTEAIPEKGLMHRTTIIASQWLHHSNSRKKKKHFSFPGKAIS